MMLEPIHPHFTFIDTYNAPDHIDSYVLKSIADVTTQLFEFQDAIQKTQRNFDEIGAAISRIESQMFDRVELFERFIRSHFTPRTIASRIIEQSGDHPTHERLLLNTRWLLDEINSYSSGIFTPSVGHSSNTSTLLDILYATYPSLLESVENKVEFFATVVSDVRNCEVLDFNDHDLFSDDMSSTFKKDFHEQIEADPKRVFVHALTMDRPSHVGGMISDIITDTDTYLKFIDAVLNTEESIDQKNILERLLRFVVKAIIHPKDEITERKYCEYAGRVFRRPDAFDIFMNFHRETRQALRSKCPPLDNYLKVKFPHD